MNKAKAQRHHARRRGAERYGLDLTNREMEEIVRAIQRGQARLVNKQSNRISVFDISFARRNRDTIREVIDETLTLPTTDSLWERVDVRVVYDRERKQIASFLPR